MRSNCGRCEKSYEPEQTHYVLCEDCWSEVACYGDPENMKFWRTASAWANMNPTEEEMKEFADSPVGQSIVKSILEVMDYKCKLNLIKQQLAAME